MKRKIIYFLLMLMLVMAGGCKGSGEEGILLEGTDQEGPEEESGNSAQAKEESAAAETLIYVQVSGAVAKPGVYGLGEGSRIFQAVELAGGVTEAADTKALNQAQVLSDGQMVYVPSMGELASQDPAVQQEDGRIDLNTATEAELMTLPGIGAARARSILDWREANGGFQQIEDLKNIEGIKDGVFSKIKDSVKVG